MADPLLSVVVVTYNSAHEISSCLQSVYADLERSLAEVIVVDSASADNTVAVVQAEFPSARLLRLSDNRGFAAAVNAGLESARGSLILLLNPDTVVHSGATRAMLDALERDSRIGVVGPRLLNADGSLQRSCREFPSLLGDLIGLAELYRISWLLRLLGRRLPSLGDHSRAGFVEWVSGACLLVRRTVLDTTGSMDECYFMYSEEMDWQYRMRADGWRVWFEPSACVTHTGGASTSGFRGERIVWQYESMIRFYRIHHGPGRVALLRAMIWLVTWPKVAILAVTSLWKPPRRQLLSAFWRILWLR